jgi:hypothetical protein
MTKFETAGAFVIGASTFLRHSSFGFRHFFDFDLQTQEEIG